jgi:hypothetical protein
MPIMVALQNSKVQTAHDHKQVDEVSENSLIIISMFKGC